MPRPQDPALRDRILDAARRVYASDPEASLDAVAQEAGVSRATVYRRFPSRDELFAALNEERGMEINREGQDGVRERILDAAGRLFPDLGLHGATMERIAEAANVGPATVYRHFGDKEGLLRAWLDLASPRRAVSELGRIGGKDVESDLRALATMALRFMGTHHGLIRMTLSADPETRAMLGRVRSSSETTRATLAAYLRRQMEAGNLRQDDAEFLAEMFFGMLMARAVISPGFSERPPSDPEADAARLVRLFLEGLVPRS